MKVRILGCGTSFGVPRIGNDWGECDPQEPRNRRTRSSILIETGGQRLLVDCGPDLRGQLLAADVGTLDGVIITHDHADHCHGIDELRAITQKMGQPLPIYARESTTVTIDALGAVQDVKTGGDPLGYARLAACIADQVREWRFPPAKGATTARTIPLKLKP